MAKNFTERYYDDDQDDGKVINIGEKIQEKKSDENRATRSEHIKPPLDFVHEVARLTEEQLKWLNSDEADALLKSNPDEYLEVSKDVGWIEMKDQEIKDYNDSLPKNKDK